MKTYKWMPAFIAALLFLFLFALGANAETEGIFTYTAKGESAVITAINPTDAAPIVIPDELGGLPVTGVVAGGGILSGSPYVVEELVIPAGVTEMDLRQFASSKLKRFTVDANNPSYSSADGALLDKEQTQLIKCPCYYPQKTYAVPSSVKKIAFAAFSNAKYLENVILPEGLTELGNQAFALTASLKHIEIPDTVTKIGENCFAYNSAIESIVIPESVTSLPMSAFSDCTALHTATILGNITMLPSWVFDNTALKTVALPASLTFVNDSAFIRTGELERILFAGTREQWDAVQVMDNNGSFPDAEVICDFPAAAYKRIGISEENGLVTIDGIGALPGSGTYHFWDDHAGTAQTVYISGGITRIGEGSFVGFPSLSTVVISSPGITAAPGAFEGCEALQTLIVLGEGTVPENAFVNCSEDILFFGTEGAAPPERADGALGYIPVSYADGVLRYGGTTVQDAYSFFDVLSVFCDYYGEIRELSAADLALTDVPFYAWDAASGTRSRIGGHLKDCTIYPQIEAGGETRRVTFNELCAGIADGSVSSFYLTTVNDGGRQEVQDTPIRIVDRIKDGIQRILRAIVTLLNKLFRLIKSFGK